MARQNEKHLPSGKVVGVLKGRKRLGKIPKDVAPVVVERCPPLSEPLDAEATGPSNESCRGLGRFASCPNSKKTACVGWTALCATSPTAARARSVGNPNNVERPSTDKVNPSGLARNPPTRSDLVHRMERAIMLPSEQTRLCIGGKRAKGNRSLVNARRNRDKGKRRASERKNKKKYLPNHVQILRLFSKVLPLQHVEQFRSSFVKLGGLSDDPELSKDDPGNPVGCRPDNNAFCRPTTLPKPTGNVVGSSPENELICQTPLSWVDGALRATFGDKNVRLQRCRDVAKPLQSGSDNVAGKNQGVSVCVDATENDDASDYFLEFIAMDCVLERALETVCSSEEHDGFPSADRDHVDHVFAEEPEHILAKFDFRFRTAIIVLPAAGVFYCARERRKETKGILNSHVPLDISWLRQKCDRGAGVEWFDRGAYVRRLSTGYENMSQPAMDVVGCVGQGSNNCITCAVWKWGIRRQGICIPRCILSVESKFPAQSLLLAPSSSELLVYQAYQCPDDSGPRLPPDFIDGKDLSEQPASERRITYNERLMSAPSVRRHCRRYARACLHRMIPPNAWTIDPKESPNVDVVVTVQASQTCDSKFHVLRRSVIQIRYLTELRGSVALLRRIRNHAQSVAEGAKSGSARAGCGDMGSMHPIGTRVMHNLTEGKYTSSSDDDSLLALGDAVQASAMLASMSVPAVLRVVQDLETDSGLKPIPQMSGDGGPYKVSTSMDLSVNLSNASHFDVHDASQGFSIWTEDAPGLTKNWFFVLPNVYGTRPGSGDSYNGLVIRLSHGVLISWDGRIIRHCTSVMERKAAGRKKHDNNVYGSFFAAKTKHISLGQQQCESRLANAWYQDVTGVLEQGRKEDEEAKLADAKQASLPALESDNVVGVKVAVCDEMVELTDNTVCPGAIQEVVTLLSDGDSLLDDDVEDSSVKVTTSTWDLRATLLRSGEIRTGVEAIDVDKFPEPGKQECGLVREQERHIEDSGGARDDSAGRAPPGLGRHLLEEQPDRRLRSRFQNLHGGYGLGGCMVGRDVPHQNWQKGPGGHERASDFINPHRYPHCGRGRGGGRDSPRQRWAGPRFNDCLRGRDCGTSGRETGRWCRENGGGQGCHNFRQASNGGIGQEERRIFGRISYEGRRQEGRHNFDRISYNGRQQGGRHNSGRMSYDGRGYGRGHNYGRMSYDGRGQGRHGVLEHFDNFGRTSNDAA